MGLENWYKYEMIVEINACFIVRFVMYHSFINLVIFGAFCFVVHGQSAGDENCETLPFQLHLIKGF